MPSLARWVAGSNLDLSTIDSAAQRGIQDPASGLTIAQVTIEEDGDDELLITEHPVQQGATITDHAVKRPCELRIRLGWSTAYLADLGSSIRAIYDQLLRLQASRVPFTVYTGKRDYQNMLVQSLRTHTDQKLEHTFIADVALREVILVNTNVTGGGAIYNAIALANAEANTPTAEAGPVNPLPASVTSEQIAAMGGT